MDTGKLCFWDHISKGVFGGFSSHCFAPSLPAPWYNALDSTLERAVWCCRPLSCRRRLPRCLGFSVGAFDTTEKSVNRTWCEAWPPSWYMVQKLSYQLVPCMHSWCSSNVLVCQVCVQLHACFAVKVTLNPSHGKPNLVPGPPSPPHPPL